MRFTLKVFREYVIIKIKVLTFDLQHACIKSIMTYRSPRFSLERTRQCFTMSTGVDRRNFLSTHVPPGWRARSFSRMTHRTDRGLVVFRTALGPLSRLSCCFVERLKRFWPQPEAGKWTRSALSSSARTTITLVSPQRRSIIFCVLRHRAEYTNFFSRCR